MSGDAGDEITSDQSDQSGAIQQQPPVTTNSDTPNYFWRDFLNSTDLGLNLSQAADDIEPTLFQSETGLSRSRPGSFETYSTYKHSQFHEHTQKFDFSNLQAGDAIDPAALSKMLGHTASLSELKNAQAFLYTIAFSEGTLNKDGSIAYNMLVGGGRFNDLSHHPDQLIALSSYGISSSAAGFAQFLHSTWEDCQAALNLKDMSPASQRAAALYLISQAGALGDVAQGHFEDAAHKVRGIWASFPDAGYGQHENQMATLEKVFETSRAKQDSAFVTNIPTGPSSGIAGRNFASLRASAITQTIFLGDSISHQLQIGASGLDEFGQTVNLTQDGSGMYGEHLPQNEAINFIQRTADVAQSAHSGMQIICQTGRNSVGYARNPEKLRQQVDQYMDNLQIAQARGANVVVVPPIWNGDTGVGADEGLVKRTAEIISASARAHGLKVADLNDQSWPRRDDGLHCHLKDDNGDNTVVRSALSRIAAKLQEPSTTANVATNTSSQSHRTVLQPGVSPVA
jgi:muramidase (phage lysozyme)